MTDERKPPPRRDEPHRGPSPTSTTVAETSADLDFAIEAIETTTRLKEGFTGQER